MRIQLPTGEYRNELRQPIWDTIDLPAATDPTTLGIVSFFQNVAGKNLSQTNLKTPGQLEADVSFRCLGMALDAQCYTAADQAVLPLVMAHSYFQFKITDTTFYQANGTYVFGRIKQSSAAAVTVAATTIHDFYQHAGDEAVQAVGFSGKHVLDIGSLQSFRVDFQVQGLAGGEVTAATPSVRIPLLLSLKGLQRRPVL